MRNSDKKKSPVSTSAKEPKSSGKKLVQARLPFKILPSPASVDTAAVDESSKPESRKRKLSYGEDEVVEKPNKVICKKSDIKENLIDDESTTKKKGTTVDRDVIVLDDSEDAPATPKTLKGEQHSEKPSSANKMTIKLPMSSKKRRKSKRLSEVPVGKPESESSDNDTPGKDMNPQKRAKLADKEGKDEKEASKEEVIFIGEVEEDANKTESENERGKEDDKVQKKDEKESSKEVVGSPKTKGKHEPKQLKTSESIEGAKTPKSNSLRRGRSITSDTGSTKKPTKDSKNVSDDSKKDTGETKKREGSPQAKNPSGEKDHPQEKRVTRSNSVSPLKSKEKPETKVTEEKSSKSPKKAKADSKETPPDSSSNAPKNAETIDLTSANDDKNDKKKVITPGQSKKLEQRQKQKEEKERKLRELREEKERQKQKEKEERELQKKKEQELRQKEKDEKEEQKRKEREEKEEQKRKEREEKEEQRKREKEEKERKRLAEIEAKNEEKRKKDEAKAEELRKREEEKRRKDLEKEEEENKKKKAAQAFTKFFVQSKAPRVADDDQSSKDSVEKVGRLAFRPFQVKGDMKLAPTVRRVLTDKARSSIEKLFSESNEGKEVQPLSELYLSSLKSGRIVPNRQNRTISKDDDEVLIVEDELESAGQTIDDASIRKRRYRAKYFRFHENRRPPFHGTWRKKSAAVTPRKPFGVDKKFFDYEVDSDDEWEEEEPGESIDISDDEKRPGDEDEPDTQVDDEYELDDEMFVPHGHLSDEELQDEDDIMQDNSREAQKAKLKLLQLEFDQEMTKKTQKIKPRLIGIIWQDENGNKPELCPDVIWESLSKRAMIFTEPPMVCEPPKPEPETGSPSTEKTKKVERMDFTEDLIKELINLVHGNQHKKQFLIQEFIAHVAKKLEVEDVETLGLKKMTVREKIDEMAEWTMLEGQGDKKKKKKLCWIVSPEFLSKFGLEELSSVNRWLYTLKAKQRYTDTTEKTETAGVDDESSKETEVKETVDKTPKSKKKPASEITKFTKVLTDDERVAMQSPKTKPTKKVEKVDSPKPGKSVTKSTAAPSTPTTPKSTPPVTKKRVPLLMSVPRGQKIPQQSKNALISNFLKKGQTQTAVTTTATASSSTPMDVDEVVLIDD